MNSKQALLMAAGAVVLGSLIGYQAVLAGEGQQWILLHHEAQGEADESWTKCMPDDAWSGHDDHEGDSFDGPFDNNKCEESEPTDVPATATPIPTDEPTPTETEEPTPTPDDLPTREPTPTIVDWPTPEVTPFATEKPCKAKKLGMLFTLIGPDGQVGYLASYQRNPNTGDWAIPSAPYQLQCLGWVAVSAPHGDVIEIGCDGVVTIVCRRCAGGGPPEAYGDN